MAYQQGMVTSLLLHLSHHAVNCELLAFQLCLHLGNPAASIMQRHHFNPLETGFDEQ